MDWDKLRIFHAVAKEGNLTHAAEILGITQPSVSRQISALEKELNIILFHRHARGLKLTSPGEQLYKTVKEVMANLEVTMSRLVDMRDKPFGELKITTTIGFGTTWLAPRMKLFTQKYPDVKPHLILCDEELDLSMREADVGIRFHASGDNALIQRRLFTAHFHAYASKEYLETRGTPKSAKDLDNHNLLAMDGNLTALEGYINALLSLGRNDKNPREPNMVTNNILGLRRLAESGAGIAVLPDYLAVERKKLISVMNDKKAPAIDTYFVYPEELKDTLRIKVFREFILAEAQTTAF